VGITQITLITVPVTDQDRAKDFYTALGFDVTNDHVMTEAEMPPEPGLRWLQLTPPGGGTTIVLANWTVGGLKPGGQHIAVACDGVQALHAEFSKEYTASPVFEAPFGQFFSVDDPDGNGVMVIEETPS
jgi:catechol 2,3-dioxygenase-like lactoylglutathione lyase family enzyme